MQVAFERRIAPVVAREITATVRRAADGFNADGRASPAVSAPDHEARLSRLIVPAMIATGRAFGMRVLEDAPKGMRLIEVKAPRVVFLAAMRRFIETHAAERVTRIAGTTRTMIREAIDEGAEDGLGVDQIARRIVERAGGVIARARAAVIARTEVHTAANVGSTEAAASLGIAGLLKEWIAAEDARTRPAHADADGQQVSEDESFVVGGESLAFPGDPAGSAENVINCRCVVGHVVPGL